MKASSGASDHARLKERLIEDVLSVGVDGLAAESTDGNHVDAGPEDGTAAAIVGQLSQPSHSAAEDDVVVGHDATRQGGGGTRVDAEQEQHRIKRGVAADAWASGDAELRWGFDVDQEAILKITLHEGRCGELARDGVDRARNRDHLSGACGGASVGRALVPVGTGQGARDKRERANERGNGNIAVAAAGRNHDVYPKGKGGGKGKDGTGLLQGLDWREGAPTGLCRDARGKGTLHLRRFPRRNNFGQHGKFRIVRGSRASRRASQ